MAKTREQLDAEKAAQLEAWYKANPSERPEYKAAQAAAEAERIKKLTAAAADTSNIARSYAQDNLTTALGGDKGRADELIFNKQNPDLVGKVADYRNVQIIDVPKADGSKNPDGTIATERKIVGGQSTASNYLGADGRRMSLADARTAGKDVGGLGFATAQDMLPRKSPAMAQREIDDAALNARAALDLKNSQRAQAEYLSGAGKQQNDAFRQELIRNGGITDQDVAERNANLAKMGLPPFQPTPLKDWTAGMKKGGPVQKKMAKPATKTVTKSFAKGGVVKGGGCAKRGVKKLRML